MTPPPDTRTEDQTRYRLHRAGILNVWQYDEQVFTFAEGRLLLRGANGAGKSKTLEMLLPFVLDGDKSRINASGKQHTSLLWLMTDGIDAGNRVGYVWVEFLREVGGQSVPFTCGIGIRASVTGRSVSAWHFTTTRRVGHDLSLEDEGGPLSRPRLVEALAGDGQVFDKPSDYKAHIGRHLFGLDVPQYDEVLRLLYWLRQPQVGEDIEPAKLAHELSQALPQLDEQAVQSAGDTFDELTAVGEQLDRRARAAEALQTLATTYTEYGHAILADRARALAEAVAHERSLGRDVARADSRLREATDQLEQADQDHRTHRVAAEDATVRLTALRGSPEYRDQRRLAELAGSARSAQEHAEAAVQLRDQRAADVTRARARLTDRATRCLGHLTRLSAHLTDVGAQLGRDVPGSTLAAPARFAEPQLDAQHADELTRQSEDVEVAVERSTSAVRVRRAAVDAVRTALGEAEEAVAARERAERAADAAEARWEVARQRRLTTETETDEHRQTLAIALGSWRAERPDLDLTALADLAELDDDTIIALPQTADTAARDALRRALDDRARAEEAARRAEAELQRLQLEHDEVSAERDPAPPAPVLPRTHRPDGHALWQVVDFADDVADDERAGLEAALQASGLLDAWLRPDGTLLGDEHLDSLLSAIEVPPPAGSGSASAPKTLSTALVVDLPPDSDLADATVRAVLDVIALGEHDGPAWIGTDGRWGLGPACGRARKDQAQYIGATARAAERERRLAVIEVGVAKEREAAAAAQRDGAEATAVADRLADWVRRVPSGQALLRSRTLLVERAEHETVAEQANRAEQRAAHDARALAHDRQQHLERRAAEHDLPTAGAELAAIEQRLHELTDRLRDVRRMLPRVTDDLDEWRQADTALTETEAALTDEEERAHVAVRRAEALAVEVAELRDTAGAAVAVLQQRIAEVTASHAQHEGSARTAMDRANSLRGELGRAEAEIESARKLVTEQRAHRVSALESLLETADVPSVVDTADGSVRDVLARLRGLTAHTDREVPADTGQQLAGIMGISEEPLERAQTRLWRVFGDATSGPAADHHPAIAEFGPVLSMSARDDKGEATVIATAARVAAAVEADRELLTERERTQFEQHILGELGDAIRRRRRDAEELVAAMNDQLAHVTTSQGIRTRLRWALRDDVPPDARAAVDLLTQPVGALVPEERADLRDALHRLIGASRAERPELSYGEHLASALDYRTWSQFTIHYTRPERAGHWERLHRRSPLSQGEQKVLCYLPLFAAAAAHFTSLAGAAPHAPRLVLLDDAFPKIDQRTHPLLFGLLVDLELDFVITSERLWGDHSTVPSLAIYEALRSPGQRGIAQYSYTWDGRVLQGVG